jgi:hypothetical protein
MTVGTLVIIGFLVTLVLNIRTARSGAEFAWQKIVSFGSATLLILQYMLGFSLLSDHDITGYHYLIALAAIIPIGFEHGYASQRPTATERGKLGAVANVWTLVLVVIAYMIGETS